MSKRIANLLHPRKVMAVLVGCCVAALANCFVEVPPFSGSDCEELNEISDLDGRWVLMARLPRSDADPWATAAELLAGPPGADDPEGRPAALLTIRSGEITRFEFAGEGVNALTAEEDGGILWVGIDQTMEFGLSVTQRDPSGGPEVLLTVSFIASEIHDCYVKGSERRYYEDDDRMDLTDASTFMVRAEPWRCCLNGECVERDSDADCTIDGGVWVDGDCLFDTCAALEEQLGQINDLADLDGRWVLEEVPGGPSLPTAYFTIRGGQITHFGFDVERQPQLARPVQVTLVEDNVSFFGVSDWLFLGGGVAFVRVTVSYSGPLVADRRSFDGWETRSYDEVARRDDDGYDAYMRRAPAFRCCLPAPSGCAYVATAQACIDGDGVWVEDCLFDPCDPGEG